MASKTKWKTDKLITLKNLKEDYQYGYALQKLYADSFYGINELFKRGITGIILDEEKPKTLSSTAAIMQSGQFSRPEDYKHGMPMLSGGGHLECRVDLLKRQNFRHYQAIRLQGDFEEVLGEDWPDEDTGTVAVSVMHHLATNGIMPINYTKMITLHALRINGMIPDEDHKEDWIAIEIDIFAHNHTQSPLMLPMQKDTGQININDLNALKRKLGED